ncbi:hypothetical protein BX600DRAFT_435017 [Xylariales sp. PMI_506]|nr:hypothetical protein BX600DRAFT_435017 [Xylariales sp. PMI_506]
MDSQTNPSRPGSGTRLQRSNAIRRPRQDSSRAASRAGTATPTTPSRLRGRTTTTSCAGPTPPYTPSRASTAGGSRTPTPSDPTRSPSWTSSPRLARCLQLITPPSGESRPSEARAVQGSNSGDRRGAVCDTPTPDGDRHVRRGPRRDVRTYGTTALALPRTSSSRPSLTLAEAAAATAIATANSTYFPFSTDVQHDDDEEGEEGMEQREAREAMLLSGVPQEHWGDLASYLGYLRTQPLTEEEVNLALDDLALYMTPAISWDPSHPDFATFTYPPTGRSHHPTGLRPFPTTLRPTAAAGAGYQTSASGRPARNNNNSSSSSSNRRRGSATGGPVSAVRGAIRRLFWRASGGSRAAAARRRVASSAIVTNEQGQRQHRLRPSMREPRIE